MSINASEKQAVKRSGISTGLRLPDLVNRDSNLSRLFIIMVVVFLVMAALKPNPFLTWRNFSSMAFQMPEFGIMAIAMMAAMLTGGIDLSIVGIANISGILAALVMVRFTSQGATAGQDIFVIVLAISVSLVVGIICGLINGLLISKVEIPPILATMGTMQLYMGTAIIITGGKAVLGFPGSFAAIGNGTVAGFPVPMILFIIIAVIFSFLFNRSSLGLKLYMMGTNPVASKFSGINNVTMTVRTYLISGLLAAISGLIIIARTNSAKADYGTSYTLQAILVAVMGGVSVNGGFGKIIGIIMAMLTLQFLSSGFNAMHFSNFFKDFIWGAVLIIVMLVNYVSETLKSRARARKQETQF